MKVNRVTVWVDGASRGNPGPAAIGVIIKDEQGKIIAGVSRCIGTTTNNQAEYRAIITALEKAIELGATHVVMNSDSELVVRQLNGRYRVRKAELKPLSQNVKRLTGLLEVFTITHIPRRQNAEADRLANKALNLAVD